MNNKKKMLFYAKGIFFCFLLLSGQLFAQNDFTGEINSALKQKPKLDIRIGTRNSFITTRLARIRGVKVGLDYNKTVKIGLSYNWLASSIQRSVESKGNEFDARLRYQYIAPYFEYAFFKESPWEISVPMNVGLGWSDYYRITENIGTRTEKNFVLTYEPYMMGSYTVLKYFALGAGVGYRLVLVGGADLEENFNSPIYVFKFQVLLGKLWLDLNERIN